MPKPPGWGTPRWAGWGSPGWKGSGGYDAAGGTGTPNLRQRATYEGTLADNLYNRLSTLLGQSFLVDLAILEGSLQCQTNAVTVFIGSGLANIPDTALLGQRLAVDGSIAFGPVMDESAAVLVSDIFVRNTTAGSNGKVVLSASFGAGR